MTNPQDPNQPQGWGQQPDPNQPGWAAPTPPAAPGWGAPPPQQPGQPGWGAPPPPQQPGQPGWGAPPPAGPGWGAPPPAGYPPAPGYQPAPGWGTPPPPKKKGHGCLIAFIIVLVIFLVGVGGCVAFVAINVGPYVSMESNLQRDLGGKVSNVTFTSKNGTTTWIVTINSAYESQAGAIACTVKSDLHGTQFANDGVQIVDDQGTVLATAALCR
jgi:hypothetical protein